MGKRIHDYRLLFRRVFLVSYDVVAILAASALALLLRFEFSYSQIDAKYIEMIWTYFPINILTTVVVFYFFQHNQQNENHPIQKIKTPRWVQIH